MLDQGVDISDAVIVAAVVIVVFIIALELTVYEQWRDRLYDLYLDYYNRKTHPLVPEAWRISGGGYTIDFWLEWKMFFSPIVPEMGDQLIRRLKRQKAVVICFYVPIAIFFTCCLGPVVVNYLRQFHLLKI